MTKSLRRKPQRSTLGQSIARGNTGVAIAEAGQFNPLIVVEARELKRDLADELEVKRNIREEWSSMKGKKFKALVKEVDLTIEQLEIQLSHVIDYPTIGQMEREGDNDIKSTLILLLIDLYEWFDEKPNDNQLNQMADLIIANYGGLTLEEFAVFLSQVIDGRFAQVFTLKPVYIMRWLKKFRDDLQADAIQRSANRHLQTKPSDNRSIQDYYNINVEDTRIADHMPGMDGQGVIKKKVKKQSSVGAEPANDSYFKKVLKTSDVYKKQTPKLE